MSCFSFQGGSRASRYLLLQEKLRLFTNRFQNVLYPAIMNKHGDFITLEEVDKFPPQYGAYIHTLRTLCEKILKNFCNGNCKKLKVRAESRALFSLYSIDENHVLVFYSEIDPEISKAIDPTSFDESLTDLLAEMQLILSSNIEVV